MALFIFAVTLFFIYFRPFGIPLWLTSSVGGLCAFVFGVVDFTDILFVWEMVWDSSFSLVGLIIFAICLEKLGFFNALANSIIQISKNKQTLQISTFRFYIFIIIFGFILSSFFSNDGAILILTPIIIALFSSIKPAESSQSNSQSHKSTMIIFLLFMSFVSDFGSNIFIFSNLTNIISSHSFDISFFEFFAFMALPQAFALIGSLFIFWIIFRKKLPKYLAFKTIDSNIPPRSIMIVGFALLGFLLFGIILGDRFGIPISVFAMLSGIISAIVVCLYKKSNLVHLMKDSPFSVVIFSLGLFVVVYGLNNMGFVDFLQSELESIMQKSQFMQIMLIGVSSSFGSSIINNLPMIMLGDLALSNSPDYLVFSHILGCNIGSKLTPIGSLATLLWLANIRRYDIKVSFFRYIVIAFFVTIPVLFFALFGLYLSVILI